MAERKTARGQAMIVHVEQRNTERGIERKWRFISGGRTFEHKSSEPYIGDAAAHILEQAQRGGASLQGAFDYATQTVESLNTPERKRKHEEREAMLRQLSRKP